MRMSLKLTTTKTKKDMYACMYVYCTNIITALHVSDGHGLIYKYDFEMRTSSKKKKKKENVYMYVYYIERIAVCVSDGHDLTYLTAR